MPLVLWNNKLLIVGGKLAMGLACCCESGCCALLPETIYAHVTFTCGGSDHTDVIPLTEAQYTGPCLANSSSPRIWEKTHAAVNNGLGDMLIRFACVGTVVGQAVYYGCHNGCNFATDPCAPCPGSSSGWVSLATARRCNETTLGSITIIPAPSACGACSFPPVTKVVITYKTTA